MPYVKGNDMADMLAAAEELAILLDDWSLVTRRKVADQLRALVKAVRIARSARDEARTQRDAALEEAKETRLELRDAAQTKRDDRDGIDAEVKLRVAVEEARIARSGWDEALAARDIARDERDKACGERNRAQDDLFSARAEWAEAQKKCGVQDLRAGGRRMRGQED